MKLVLAILLLSMTACVAAPSRNLSCDERCSLDGMACTGEQVREGVSSASDGIVSVHGSASDVTLICVKDPKAKNEIDAIREATLKKLAPEKSSRSKSSSLTN